MFYLVNPFPDPSYWFLDLTNNTLMKVWGRTCGKDDLLTKPDIV